MWPSELKTKCQDIRQQAKLLRQAAIEHDEDMAEEAARELEGIAGSIVAAMQNEGLWCAIQAGGSGGGIADGDFPEGNPSAYV